MIFTSLLYSLRNTAPTNGGVPQWVCPAFIYRLQVVQVTKITSERLDLRILLKQNLKATYRMTRGRVQAGHRQHAGNKLKSYCTTVQNNINKLHHVQHSLPPFAFPIPYFTKSTLLFRIIGKIHFKS